MPANPTDQLPLILRIMIPAVLILGLLVTTTWTVALGYGVVELVDRTL
jgi:hypothetical protein